MAIQLSERVGRIKPSPTLAVAARATALRAEGKDIIDLGVGEPDFDTPDTIKNAAIKALHEGKTKYTAVDGIPSLKEAIIEKCKRFNQLTYTKDQVMVSTGGKQCIYNLMQAYINPGDEVIIPAPFWVSYPDMVLLAEGVPKIVQTSMENRFKITPTQLESAITSKTTLFILNSPSNPTGMSYTKEELQALSEVLIKHPHVLIATDDMYEHILWNGRFYNIIMTNPELYDRTIILSGVSKAYAMTGWRIGYAAGPDNLLKAMKNIQSQSTSNPCSIAQAAAEAALRGPLTFTETMVKAFKERHDFLVGALNKLPGVSCEQSDGTFYAFPCVQEAMNRLNIKTDVEFADHLIHAAEVATVPGSAFGTPGYLRLSYATSMENLMQATARLSKILKPS